MFDHQEELDKLKRAEEERLAAERVKLVQLNLLNGDLNFIGHGLRVPCPAGTRAG
jgi:hypothetical protein